MQVPEGVEDYCTTYADCTTRYPDAMAKWDAYFTVYEMHTHTHTHTKTLVNSMSCINHFQH